MSSPNPDHAPCSRGQAADAILGRYLGFLKTNQGLADATLVLRRLHVDPFLRTLEKSGELDDLYNLAPNTIHDYIIEISRPLTQLPQFEN